MYENYNKKRWDSRSIRARDNTQPHCHSQFPLHTCPIVRSLNRARTHILSLELHYSLSKSRFAFHTSFTSLSLSLPKAASKSFLSNHIVKFPVTNFSTNQTFSSTKQQPLSLSLSLSPRVCMCKKLRIFILNSSLASISRRFEFTSIAFVRALWEDSYEEFSITFVFYFCLCSSILSLEPFT